MMLQHIEELQEMAELTEKLSTALSARRHAQVGTQVGIGKMRVQIGDQTWEFEPHNAKRIK